MSKATLRRRIEESLADLAKEGYAVDDLKHRLATTPDSYDALLERAEELDHLSLRPDWPYVEPLEWVDVRAECTGSSVRAFDAPSDANLRAETGFLASVCGCMLGKPLEVAPTLAQLQRAFEAIGEWPIRDYVSERIRPHLELNGCWPFCVRERIRWVHPDDDLNYTILGMLNLERFGAEFTHSQLASLWAEHVVPAFTWGPEQTMITRIATRRMESDGSLFDPAWRSNFNPGAELCGALIRADAYGFASPGNPALAAELAFRDASFTHRRTGVYASMFVAALIALAFGGGTWSHLVRGAASYLPSRSRLYQTVEEAHRIVALAESFESGYEAIHARFGDTGHCQIHHELASLVLALRFAQDPWHGVCLQVMQGNDTDSYGCTAGSILGVWMGPGSLDPTRLEIFNDDFRTSLAQFEDRSLASVARRVGFLATRET